jgi:hypothetical protein
MIKMNKELFPLKPKAGNKKRRRIIPRLPPSIHVM